MENQPSPPLWAERIKRERLRRSWSQNYLAEQLNTDARTVRHWESGAHCPALEHRRRLVELYQLSPEDLGFIEEERNTQEAQPSLTDSENTISPSRAQEAMKQSDSHHFFPALPLRRKWWIALGAIVLITVPIGVFVVSGGVGGPSATAMALYHQYTDQPPTRTYDRTDGSVWSLGDSHGSCNQALRMAQSPGRDRFGSCITDAPTAPNFALQATLSIEQGESAGLVFGSAGSGYYALLICREDGYHCITRNVSLDYVLPGPPSYCFGPGPNATYLAAGPGACTQTFTAVHTDLSVPNVFTVIVQGSYIYLYVNTAFIGRIDLTAVPSQLHYPTSGQIGFCAYGSLYPTDVSMQSFKVWI